MTDIVSILLRALLVILAIITLCRIHGLRSFSKMSGFDFAITVSIGSVLAGAVTTLSTPLWQFCVALIGLFAVQIVLAQARVRSDAASSLLDNAPLLIMENGVALEANLAKGGMTTEDLFAKLREANAYDLNQVRAVILESTGDVSVLHGPSDGPEVSEQILQDVRRS